MINNYQYINLEYLYTIADNDPLFVNDMINDFIKIIPGYIYELEKAIDENNSDLIYFLAQKLKSSVTIVGVSDILAKADGVAHAMKFKQDIITAKREMVSVSELFLRAKSELEIELNVINH
ncbi:MAG: hypothetical protein MUC81_07515 [Bacteroidia bacterium]|jgi:HPt (histidine-containing phosphotransfer) domain-containing protein|nr:hypothetical protein [Bacteroidia bacterium]